MHAFEPQRFPLARILLVLAAFVGLSTSCVENTPEEAVQRDADFYETALMHLIDASEAELTARWSDPVVFVEVLEPESVDLETQIAVVDDLEEEYRIRFIDELAEAVEMEVAGLPVREGSLLVAFGPLIMEQSDVILHGEYYLDADSSAAFEYRFVVEPAASGTGTVVTMVDAPSDVATELVVAQP